MRRFVRGEPPQRSTLDPDRLIAELRDQALERLREADDLWLILDGSDLRKPHAHAMEALQLVNPLKGAGMVPGSPTLTVLGLGGEGRRGMLDHRLSSARADDFVSVPSITRQVIATTGAALADWTQPVTLIMDRGFDDQAIVATAWRQGWHTVWRVLHRERLVRADAASQSLPLEQLAATTLAPIGRIDAEMLVQKTGQARAKRQPVTVQLRACPVLVPVHWQSFPGAAREQGEQPCWLVEASLVNTDLDPWWCSPIGQ